MQGKVYRPLLGLRISLLGFLCQSIGITVAGCYSDCFIMSWLILVFKPKFKKSYILDDIGYSRLLALGEGMGVGEGVDIGVVRLMATLFDASVTVMLLEVAVQQSPLNFSIVYPNLQC